MKSNIFIKVNTQSILTNFSPNRILILKSDTSKELFENDILSTENSFQQNFDFEI